MLYPNWPNIRSTDFFDVFRDFVFLVETALLVGRYWHKIEPFVRRYGMFMFMSIATVFTGFGAFVLLVNTGYLVLGLVHADMITAMVIVILAGMISISYLKFIHLAKTEWQKLPDPTPVGSD